MDCLVPIKNELVEIGRSESGWAVLYVDKTDGSFWELIYPNSNDAGSGEPSMTLLSQGEVTNRYKIYT